MHENDLTPAQADALARGLAKIHRGRIIPILAGGDGRDEDEPLFATVPTDLSALSDEDLESLIADFQETIDEIAATPSEFVSAEFTTADLLDATRTAVESVKSLRAALASRTAPAAALTTEEQAELDALATSAGEPAAVLEADEPADEPTDEPAPADEPAADATIVAAGRPARRRALPRPVEHAPAETETGNRSVALLAAGGATDMQPGARFDSELSVADAMCRRHLTFGQTGPGTVEKFAIARALWKDEYPTDRRLQKDEVLDLSLVAAVTNQALIKRNLADRLHEMAKGNLTASGGLCAPVTPYYNLQFISVPVRPVQAALPSFTADRGGLRYARPASLSAVTSGVGLLTAAQDGLGGTSATKSCQVIPCPPFQETDVDIIYHCLQFGNLGARAFPELVAQWNNLVLAAHARLAEANLLTQIDGFSTQVTAGNLGLGATAALLGQFLAAANGMRSRNRMDPQAVLRVIAPYWAIDLMISDVIRSQFQRFDTDEAKLTALLRTFNIEPTWHIDGANGRNQVFDAQPGDDAALLPFPEEVVWYMFPEGSFIYLDGGQLELGIVRDSILNKTNDFQIFGETFENVAFVGIESIAVASTVCDSGTVSLPASVTCPIDYSL